MIMISDLVADTDFDTDFCLDDVDASYYEDQASLAQDCAEYQLYVWGD
jgi:hypothetical protein